MTKFLTLTNTEKSFFFVKNATVPIYIFSIFLDIIQLSSSRRNFLPSVEKNLALQNTTSLIFLCIGAISACLDNYFVIMDPVVPYQDLYRKHWRWFYIFSWLYVRQCRGASRQSRWKSCRSTGPSRTSSTEKENALFCLCYWYSCGPIYLRYRYRYPFRIANLDSA
jgi:hypothetical protein